MNKNKKPTNVEIGEKLRDLRLKKDVKETDVARAIGRNVSTYSRFETGNSMPSDSIVEKLADYYEVDVKDIKEPLPTINNVDSFNESPSSGNFNSYTIPETLFHSVIDTMKNTAETNIKLMGVIIENQKMMMEYFKK